MKETTRTGRPSSGSFDWAPIVKPQSVRAKANITDYERTCSEFSWEKAADAELDGSIGWMNIAHEAVDRHAQGEIAKAIALRWLNTAGAIVDYTDADPHFDTVHTTADDLALLHFTSGTTGRPKGAMHAHGAVVAHRVTARYALDLRQGDIFWSTADPGWVTGMSYGVIAPLCLGATVISDEAEFDPKRWYDILSRQRVSVWYTAPTALRMLMRFGDRLPDGTDLSALRFITSVGEPLNPEVVVWSERVLGHVVHDNWWQTETGAIMVANFAATDVRPGSMGRPLPGIEATVVRRGSDGRVLATDGDLMRADVGETGELALRAGWPSMFRGYRGEPEGYGACSAARVDGARVSGRRPDAIGRSNFVTATSRQTMYRICEGMTV
ncbi:AMP-binding protein [Nocardia cyriacigeorgica]|uniref:AMP-binding protein n=1 Tax=Nocardia cyriacigeorgica TaxID=135487 RepID=A0ABX0CIF7_9NOCA|nr:AMP-binding protein [Nocardia cyriacigeorgica]